MRTNTICAFLLSVILLGGCAGEKKERETSAAETKYWNGFPIDLSHISARRDSFNMINPQGDKVGAMEVTISKTAEKITFFDISQFDDGSIYEEATYHMDLESLNTETVDVDMTTTAAQMIAKLTTIDKQISGTYKIIQGGNEREIPVDSLFDYDLVRAEIFTYIGALVPTDTMSRELKVFSSLSGNVVTAKLSYLGEESITTELGTFDARHYYLDGKGGIPTNEIWVDKETNRQVRIAVIGAGLDIRLVKSW